MSSERRRVLVVEDSDAMRQMIAAAVRSRPHADAVECTSGLEALKVIPQYRFDLILTDINMPDINGLELIQFLRSNRETADIPLIIISSEGSPRDRQKGLALGANEYLTKPFALDRLQELLARYLPG